jgi:prepilin-type N-terminal cleavage/methylation domain-containing protein
MHAPEKLRGSMTDPGAQGRYRQSGFTLVEVLITLVLVSMVAAVAFGSLRQVFEARIRLGPYLDRSEQTTLLGGWFRQTIHALIADYDDGQHRFAGTATEISGLTASPLIAPPGTPIGFHWSLKYDAAGGVTALEYGERPSQTMQIVRWTGRDGAFAYYGEDQKWHADWPPSDADRSKSVPQLPQMVRLSGAPREAAPMIVGAVRASSVAPVFPRGVFGDLFSGNN